MNDNIKARLKTLPIGTRFGMLKVASECFRPDNKRWRVLYVICDCGVKKLVHKTALVSGNTQSCGCQIAVSNSKRLTKHGMSKGHRIFRIWANMRDRCNRPKNKFFHLYGGRGIEICTEWSEFINFHDWAINNGYSDELTIDRKDTNGNYCPDNCRWATKAVQSSNRNTPSNSKSGIKGVYSMKNKWVSQIRVSGKLIHLGSFETPESAYMARCDYIKDNGLTDYKM